MTVEPRAEAERALARRFERALSALRGMKFSYLCSPQGRLHDVQAEVGAHVNSSVQQMIEQLKQSFDSMIAPLPAEPLGEGARWQVLSRVRAVAEVLQLSEFSLQSLEGNQLEIKSEAVQVAAKRAIVMNDTHGELKEFKSQSRGTLQTDLAALAPKRMQGTLKGHVTSRVPGIGTMTVDTTLDLTFSPTAE